MQNVWGLHRIMSQFEEVSKNNGHILCCCTGMPGIGKSTIAAQMGLLLYGKKWDYKKSIIVEDTKKFIKKILETRRQFFICDEAIFLLYSRNFAKGDQKELVQELNAIRKNNHIVVFCIPRFIDLDVGIRKILTHWIDVPETGLMRLYAQRKDTFSVNIDNWYLKEIFDCLKKNNVRGLEKIDSFVCHFTCPPLESSWEKKYEQHIRSLRRVVSDPFLVPTDDMKKFLYRALRILHYTEKLKPGAITELAQHLGISDSTLRDNMTLFSSAVGRAKYGIKVNLLPQNPEPSINLIKSVSNSLELVQEVKET